MEPAKPSDCGDQATRVSAPCRWRCAGCCPRCCQMMSAPPTKAYSVYSWWCPITKVSARLISATDKVPTMLPRDSMRLDKVTTRNSAPPAIATQGAITDRPAESGHDAAAATESQVYRPVMPAQGNQRRGNFGFNRRGCNGPGDSARQQYHQDGLAGVQHEHQSRRLAAGRAQDVGHPGAPTAEMPNVLAHGQVNQHVAPRQRPNQVRQHTNRRVP